MIEEIYQQRGSENPGEGISEEYKVEIGQKQVQRKVDAGLRSADVEAVQSVRGNRVSAEGIRSPVIESQGVSLGGRKVDF